MNSFTSQIAANNIGAYEIGVLVSYVLFGVTTTQTYTYYSRFTDNSRKLKGLVALVWVCELGHALCVARTLYFYTTADCMHPNILNQSPWALDMAFVIVALIVACVTSTVLAHMHQCKRFFGFRIYMLSKRLYIPVVIWIAALLRLAGGIATPLWALQGLVVRARLLMVSTWNVGVANDLLITATLVVLLRRQRADVHKRDCNDDKFLMMPKNWTWIAISTIEARMFANSFLASLNGRNNPSRNWRRPLDVCDTHGEVLN
ncbi:hypothetical protein B0H14DRAFT_2639173 [Mycena olivaceomarginata]|nr:hypothetical protein B0H14DRAFT_2639173 [Mycena olivaceomarginata]